MPKRITDEDRVRVRALKAEGKDASEIAAIVGLARSTVYLILRDSTTPTAPPLFDVPVSEPTPGDSSAGGGGPSESPPPTTGDSDEARWKRASAAAGPDPSTEKPDGGFGGFQPESDGGSASDAKLAEGLVKLSDFVNVATCRLYAASKKVKVTPSMMKGWRYTRDETEFMRGMAPYAVPYVKVVLEKLPILFALGYGLSHVWLTAQRLEGIDELVPKKPEDGGPSPAV